MFVAVTFAGVVSFGGATFHGTAAAFGGATFSRASKVGPLVCSGTLGLSGCAFEEAVTLEIAAAAVLCWRTRWEATAILRLRYATVDLSDALWSAPVAVTTSPAFPAPFAPTARRA
ncbi:hypothetical protein AB0M57_29775 [Streptomyces sp. NPDC051597]|uniref:hypothetical protein n=1 Tax=Streptomyces sp. NPDC051597 TaxID=3155049 RepID=UPI00341DA1A3